MLQNHLSKALAGAQVAPLDNIKLRSPYALRTNPHNARTHPKRQTRAIANSIKAFGFTSPVIIDADCVILAGHGRVEAAKLLELRLIPTLQISHLNDAAKRALMLADNKIALGAGYDREKLASELGELSNLLPIEGLDLDITGFSTAEFDALMRDLDGPEDDPPDDVPPRPTTPVARLGDIWTAGQHRLICGDARQLETFKRLLRGEQAFMTFTDPPYNVRISGHVGGRGKTKHREFAVASGELSSSAFKAFLKETLGHCATFSRDGSIAYICMDWRHMAELLEAGGAVYDELKNLCVWVKTNAGQGSFYRSQHELVFVFKKGTSEHLNTFELGQHGRTRTNVWNYAGMNGFRAGRMDDLQMHPTVKPTALVIDAMKDCSKRGSIVLDPFMGSGTTIVAAEQIGRRAYGIELDPAYVDVSIERWQKMTGKDAVLEGTSFTFDELRADPGLRDQSAAKPRRTSRKAVR